MRLFVFRLANSRNYDQNCHKNHSANQGFQAGHKRPVVFIEPPPSGEFPPQATEDVRQAHLNASQIVGNAIEFVVFVRHFGNRRGEEHGRDFRRTMNAGSSRAKPGMNFLPPSTIYCEKNAVSVGNVAKKVRFSRKNILQYPQFVKSRRHFSSFFLVFQPFPPRMGVWTARHRLSPNWAAYR